ncbi:LPS export ABC transporter periplasmic protein LptC [Beijerinckia sp. L45]|uniref:LPS export ABC transporter periplasmic protein LptC n=1 Tax=Beijerinckia sp. L45 TaxID=1641855 RepID=UPI00131D29D0|nr:LPS export ABC transporter periplasmic protein LptC [Beijerinckia sp. L45]
MADVTSGDGPTDQRRATLGEGMDHTPPPRGNAVRAAGRHTARVRFLRRAMIVGSVLGISIIAIVVAFDPFHHLPHGFSVSSVGVQGTIVTMQSPKISGLRPDGSAYAITARQGVQDITTPNVMELHGVDATVGMEDNTSSRITADIGVYDGKVDTMTLTGHARIKNTSGYDMLMRSATMNFKTGVFASRERLKVNISGGDVSSNELDVTENGHKISFTGDVSSNFNPPDDAAPTADGQ